MYYTEEVKKELDRVAAVFGDYLKTSRSVELFHSDKLGYFFISIDLGDEGWEDTGLEPNYITDPREFCEILFREVLYDVLYDSGKGHASYEADAEERAETARQLSGYLEQLPQYAALADHLYDIPENLRGILNRSSK